MSCGIEKNIIFALVYNQKMLRNDKIFCFQL